LGTWQFGSREWGYGESYAAQVAPALVRRAIELGINLIDTAEAYGPARSERIHRRHAGRDPGGRTRAARNRDEVPAHRSGGADPAWQAARSRRRLGVDTIDLYYAHWPNPLVSVRRVMQAVRPLVDAGVVQRVGVSNYSVDQWRAAETCPSLPGCREPGPVQPPQPRPCS